MQSQLTTRNFRLGNHMSKIYIIASIFTCLAEQRLRGCKAWVERVMAEWLKTPCLVASRDHLNKDMDSSRKLVGKSINPTTDAYCLTNRKLYEATYI